MRTGLALVALAVVLVCVTGAVQGPVAQGPSIEGSWTFDRDGSDDPQPLVADCKSRVRGPNLRNGTTQLDTGILAHPKYKVLSETEQFRLEQTIELALDEPFAIHIRETDASILVTTGEGDSLGLPRDGEKVKQLVDGGGDIESRVSWVENYPVIERKVSGGGTVSDEYLLSKDGSALYVVVSFEGRCGQFQYRRVYSRDTTSH
jgi:hypothetical protein